MLRIGEGAADITPPLGIEMAGFHKPQGQERRITAIRQKASVRALVLDVDGTLAAIVSIDICAISSDFAKRVQRKVEEATGVSASHVRVCATHTHSMPTFRFFRQWGAISPEYMAQVEARAVDAVVAAKKDLAEADCYIGRERVIGGNSNRTAKVWKTDDAFGSQSTDDERWLDTTLHALSFQRSGGKSCPQWYHFCAHPVCYQDTEAGPDWPGLVAQRIAGAGSAEPGFLQGHIGDVNPGDGAKWIGDPEPTAAAIAPALHHALGHGEIIEIDAMRIATVEVEVPFDIPRLQEQIAFYQAHPEQCTKDVWVDSGFAKDWFDAASKWDPAQRVYKAPVTAMRLGALAFLFHPAELYSFYGLQLRTTAPFPNTLCVGYCDDFIGYVTDPKAYEQNEYAAIVVPKITDLPLFTTTAGREFTQQCRDLLAKIA